MKTVFLSAIIMAALGITAKDPLTGRWQSPLSPKGNVTAILFKNDNSFEGFINRKPFTSGTYMYSPADSVFTFTDNGCNGAKGAYKINFYSNSDSMRFTVIADTCTPRREGMLRLVLGRIK